uniref:Uncharacterized protein n=1 Tax=Schizaphis graminum TaxID=13262 RepID=A0A2S2PPH0_SCHGA
MFRYTELWLPIVYHRQSASFAKFIVVKCKVYSGVVHARSLFVVVYAGSGSLFGIIGHNIIAPCPVFIVLCRPRHAAYYDVSLDSRLTVFVTSRVWLITIVRYSPVLCGPFEVVIYLPKVIGLLKYDGTANAFAAPYWLLPYVRIVFRVPHSA